MTEKMEFPEGFYWGAATAAYQIEGGIENTDWAEAARDGRVPEAGRLADHYNLYEKDFKLARELGHTAHRFSVEWARIEPQEGVFDLAAIAHYRKVLETLQAQGLTPYLTIWHFSLPVWFSESGGFLRHDAATVFARYAKFVAEELGDLCQHISTMNEPVVYANMGWRKGSWPPFRKWPGETPHSAKYDTRPTSSIWHVFGYYRVLRSLARSHKAAYRAIKAVCPECEVSIVKHMLMYGSDRKPLNRLKAWLMNQVWTHRFMRQVYKETDTIGVNFYLYHHFGPQAHCEKTDMGWDMHPDRIYDALMYLTRYQKPLFVSEAGIADADDSRRASYITEQVKGTWRAIQSGADVRGHMYWSLLDNYEWAEGTDKRFGLVDVNYETLKRTVRPSAYVYKEICENNGIV